uniref:CCA tRNA nucleotidyltransferase n=1 Tax=Maricaulis sp. TaxID=1486257 RepID=UPI0026200874
MTTRLDPETHAWMSSAKTRAVTAALETARAGASRYVGGCVRNALLGAPVADVDIATQMKPQEVIAAAKAAGLRVIPTGVEHGTVTIISGGEPFEVTSLRRDVETDGRRAVVAFTEDWAEDAQRRDFRLNALYADFHGIIHDPTGGLEDLEARRFVFVGEARDRIREDYLRALRFFRFQAWYGRDVADPAALTAISELKAGLSTLSVERVWSELKKLLAAPDPRHALAQMRELGLLQQLLEVNGSLRVLTAIIDQDVEYGLAPDSLLRFVALADGGPE